MQESNILSDALHPCARGKSAHSLKVPKGMRAARTVYVCTVASHHGKLHFCAGCALLKLRQGQLMEPRVIIRLCMCQHLFADAFMISLSSHHTFQVQGRQLKPIRRSVCQYAYRNRSSRSYYLHQLWLGPASTVASLPLNT